jgi:hypothetical protein
LLISIRVEVLQVIDITLSELSKLIQLLLSEKAEFEIEAKTGVLYKDKVNIAAVSIMIRNHFWFF